MGSYLVVANQTLGGTRLIDHLSAVIEADTAARFTVVVPLSLLQPIEQAGVLGGIAITDLNAQRHLDEAAQARLDRLMSWLRDMGVEATGRVMPGDPLASMESVSAARTFDQIIISTLPSGVSRWLRLDLVHRATRRFTTPITVIESPPEDLPPTEEANPHPARHLTGAKQEGESMSESVYKVIELVGTSTESWEKAATAAVTKASRTLRDLRVAEVAELDLVIDDGAVTTFRAKVKVSFKYEGADED